jgi:hypothetical protein
MFYMNAQLILFTIKFTEILCSIDDYCLDLVPNHQQWMIGNQKKRHRSTMLSLTEG